MLRTFIACLGTESNSFSPMPTGLRTFEESMLYRGDATRREPTLFSEPLIEWRRLTEAHQGEVVESLAAFAQPAGITVRSVYEALRDEILADLARALPVDLVLLSLHGAMIAHGHDDCEGDLLQRVRALVGTEVVVGVELDLHCSITPAMLAGANVIVTFKEYPHVDGRERAREIFDLCLRTRQREIQPVMAVQDCRMIGVWRTPDEPVRALVNAMRAREGRDGILSLSFAHGFPWGDVPEASAKMLVIADGDAEQAQRVAREFARRVWDLREQTLIEMPGIEDALDTVASAAARPLILADVADNAGGGAPSDATFVLRAVIARGLREVLMGYFWDPVAVRFCEEAGEGAELDLRIGGKCGPMSGAPVDLRVRVQRIVRGARQSFGSSHNAMGTAVWVRAVNELDLVLNTSRTQVFHPDGFEQLGIDPRTRKAVIVKSTQHFHAGFAPIAAGILYVAGPGAVAPAFDAIAYRKFTAAYWPKVADPFGADVAT